MFCLLSAYRMPKKVEMKGKNTFRFSIIRRKIQTVFKSKALKTALLAELYGGKDAALVAQMVDSMSPLVDPPVQVVAPLPPVDVSDESDEEEWEAAAAVPDNTPPQVAPVQVAPPTPPTTPAAGPPTEDGHTAATAVIVMDSSDSDSDSD